MRTINWKLVVAVGIVGSLFLGSSTHASSVTKTASSAFASFTDTNFTSDAGLVFPKFDPALGRLTGMDISIAGVVTTKLTLKNIGATSNTATASSNVYILAQDAGNRLTKTIFSENDGASVVPVDQFPVAIGGTSVPEAYIPSRTQLVLSQDTGSQTLAAGASMTSGVLTTSVTKSQHYTNSQLLADFTGVRNYAPGTQNYSLRVLAKAMTITTAGGGNFEASQVTQASVNGSVTYYYEYSAVPEATTMLLGGMAVMPMLMQRRRERREETSDC